MELDPVDRSEFSKEWIEHIIQGIQPKIAGLKIHPVSLDQTGNSVCYVVVIPESDTAHQAKDGRYYKRYNFESQFMQDRDIRDVMERRKVPVLGVKITVRKPLSTNNTPGSISVHLTNVGRVMAKRVLVSMEVPLLYGEKGVKCGVREVDGAKEVYFIVELAIGPNDAPLFPDSSRYLHYHFSLFDSSTFFSSTNDSVRSVSDMRLTVFADEMPKIVRSFDPVDATDNWLEIV